MTRRPHVILEALQVGAQPTGTGRVIMDLCGTLAARDRGLDFTVLTTAPQAFVELAARPGWKIQDCPAARGGKLAKALFTQLALPRLVRRLEGDLLHSMQFLVPLRCACLQVATVHDMAWLLFPASVEEPRRSYYRWLVPRSLERVDAIVANSRSTAADTAKFFPRTADKIAVTPFGTPRWASGRIGRPDPVSRREGRPFFLFVGTLEPRKNLPRLLDAYEAFLSGEAARQAGESSLPELVFAGGAGWKDAGLRQHMASLRDRGHLRVLGYCEQDRLWDLYRQARALVFPSLYEGFGLPILEAMAAGLPVLTSRRSGMAEVAGQAALLVDPEDPADIASGLARLAFDGDLCADLAARGPAWAQQWSWHRTADLTVDLYRRLLAGPGGKKGLPADF